MPYMDKLAPEIASILPTVLPKGGPTQETKESIRITDFTRGEARTILERAYDGLKIRDAPEEGRKINVIYEENKDLIREPATVLKDGKADCDEVTRTAYLLAWESGVRNITMAEMKWTENTADGERRTGHSFIVLMPQSRDEQLRIYDLTYYKKGKPLQVGSDGVEAAIRREYATDAANPDFGITMRGNLNEVEAAHYDQVGEHYNEKKNWKLVGEAYKKTVVLVPNEFKYIRNLAFAYEKQGRWADAVYYYEKCIGTNEGMDSSRMHAALGVAYAKTEQKTKAINELETALRLNPDSILADEIGRTLKILRGEVHK